VKPVPEDSPYGIDNLPYGVFSLPGRPARVGVRVGDAVLDLAVALGAAGPDRVFTAGALNPFLAQGPERWAEVRERLVAALTQGVPPAAWHDLDAVNLHLPFAVADYVDFYASEHHAANLGRLLRPDSPPLLPNWRHMPVGYHGRAGTVVVSGTPIVRPCGQLMPAGADAPTFGPTAKLDIEAELGFVVGVPSRLGHPVPVDAFAAHVFGAVLVNDWSARDIQAWEYIPLGPHLGKSFATSVSPWVVPLAALRAARVPLPGQDPAPLPYLRESEPWGLDVDVVVECNGEVISRPPYRTMYWSPAQLLAHLTANGASLRTGDLFASGTISGPEPGQRGALIELTWGGRDPIRVRGEERTFLLDGDEVVLTATAPAPSGGRVGFGEVRGRVVPAPTAPRVTAPDRR
jgi:fumarylacetoacetase